MTRRKEERKENSPQSKVLHHCSFAPHEASPDSLACIIRRDKLKQDITRLENEKSDLSLELSFVRDKLQQKTATADAFELELLELGAQLDKSTRDYVRLPSVNSTYCLPHSIQHCVYLTPKVLCSGGHP